VRPAKISDLRGGDQLILSRAPSVQFVRPVPFRLIRVMPLTTYAGWCWIDGYELDPADGAVERRRLFVQYRGVIKRERPSNAWAEIPRSGAADRRPLAERAAATTIAEAA